MVLDDDNNIGMYNMVQYTQFPFLIDSWEYRSGTSFQLPRIVISHLSTHFEPEPLMRTQLVGAYFICIAFRTL